MRDLPEWLEDFAENLVDEGVSASWDRPASTSRESDSDRPTKVVSGKHSIFTHFPKLRSTQENQDHDALRRKRAGEAVPKAEKFGDLRTADHKVLCEGCVSRNNHRYAVVVQGLATQ